MSSKSNLSRLILTLFTSLLSGCSTYYYRQPVADLEMQIIISQRNAPVWCQRVIETKFPWGDNYLYAGECYEYGYGGYPIDKSKAIELYIKAAECGCGDSKLSNYGVPKPESSCSANNYCDIDERIIAQCGLQVTPPPSKESFKALELVDFLLIPVKIIFLPLRILGG